MASTRKVSTRQKMINLMYLVFIAMLALNLSTDVLNGFDLINDNIQTTIKTTTSRNNQLYAELSSSYTQNPEKTEASYTRGNLVKTKTDSLYNYLQSLKLEIAKKTDGKEGDPENLVAKDDLDAASEVFLSPIDGKGKALKAAIDEYREGISMLISDPAKKTIIQSALSTEPSARAKKSNKDWLQASFENMPSVAVVTYMSELQSNIRQAEGEALGSLLRDIDLKDFRVNELDAFVIPESKIVVSGASYKAKIIVAAIDTTQRPKVVVGGREIEDGHYQVTAGRVGSHTVEGYIELMSRDGKPYTRKFSDKYTVIEPMATVAPLLMDVVYAGIDNELSISVPGFTVGEVRASATGGSLTQKGNVWIAKPAGVGGKFIVTVSAVSNGTQRVMATKNFRIRALPDPTSFIAYTDAKGASRIFKQGTLSRSVLLSTSGIKASIDDGILDVPFTVLSFKTIIFDAMGNALQEVSAGADFSARQIEQIKRLDRGKTFFVSGIRVKGPDGVERNTPPMEIRLN